MEHNKDTFQLKNWKKNTPSEIKFWDKWINNKGDQWPADYIRRTDPNSELVGWILELINEADIEVTNNLKILDIGSGPLSYVGYKSDKYIIDLTVVDPLANEYNSLLDKNNIKNVPRPQKGYFETAIHDFGENSFDIIWCLNSLDHSIDPLIGLYNLLTVCRIGGGVVLSFHRNEAEIGDYQGLHQWNLDSLEKEGLILTAHNKKINLQGLLDQQFYKFNFLAAGNGGHKGRVVYFIKKLKNCNLSQAIMTAM